MEKNIKNLSFQEVVIDEALKERLNVLEEELSGCGFICGGTKTDVET